MTTLSGHDFLPHSLGNARREIPRAVRFDSRPAGAPTVQKPVRTVHIDRDLVGLVALGVLGLAVSFLLGSEIALLTPEDAPHAAAARSTEMVSTSQASGAPKAAAQPTFHEQFNLHPTQGDVEEAAATF